MGSTPFVKRGDYPVSIYSFLVLFVATDYYTKAFFIRQANGLAEHERDLFPAALFLDSDPRDVSQ